MIDIPCIIFAGGKSSRMGEDKALLPFDGYSSLSEYQYSRLTQIFSTVYISTKEKTKFHFQANFIQDIQESDIFAPTLGFVSAFEQLNSERIFVLSVDAPFVDASIIQELLIKDNQEYDATIAMFHDKMQPLCGIYHRSLLPHFHTMMHENRHKLGFLLQNSKTNFVSFDDAKAFMNLNDKDEYKKALKIIENY